MFPQSASPYLAPLQWVPNFLDTNLRRRIVLKLHHLLHSGKIRIIEEHKGGSRMPESIHRDARPLRTS